MYRITYTSKYGKMEKQFRTQEEVRKFVDVLILMDYPFSVVKI